ncbi:hypothetical protein [Thermococcus sp. MV5]|nr:hypothetical protein [Thermococcus sp. MV5]
MKVEELETAINRLEKIGSKYPPAIYQMVMADLVPKHLLTYLIARKP